MESKIKKIVEMNEQDKELLLKDLCARLPYGVKVAIEFFNEDRSTKVYRKLSQKNT